MLDREEAHDWVLVRSTLKSPPARNRTAAISATCSIASADRPPETAKGSTKGWLLYYLYAVERTGMLYDTSLIGNKDWYFEGAMMLVLKRLSPGRKPP